MALHLRGEVRKIFMDWLRTQRPDLVPRYEELYRRRAYAPQCERERLAALVRRRGGTGAPRFLRDALPAASVGHADCSSQQGTLF